MHSTPDSQTFCTMPGGRIRIRPEASADKSCCEPGLSSDSKRGIPAGTVSGFSLIEVCLAMMIVGSGILVLFGLFPAGLRESQYSMGDTHAGLFADYVLSGLHANASTITNWSDWADMGQFEAAVLGSGLNSLGVDCYTDTTMEAIEFPPDSGNPIKYTLRIQPVSDHPDLRSAILQVSYGMHGWMGTYFYTEFFYSGMK